MAADTVFSAMSKPHKERQELASSPQLFTNNWEVTRLGLAELLPIAILCLGLAISYLAWLGETRDAEQKLQGEFDFRIRELEHQIQQTIAGYEQTLRGVAGLYAASDQVSRQDFSAYLATLQLTETLPALQGVGFNQMVHDYAKKAHVAAMRQQGLSKYLITPDDQRSIYAPVVYLEPHSALNILKIGYDAYSEPALRAALEQARDSGQIAMSDAVMLKQPDGRQQPTFVMYFPIYKKGLSLLNVDQRRDAITGWITMSFRLKDLMASVFQKQAADIDIRIYDGTNTSYKTLIYEDDQRIGNHKPRLQRAKQIELAGHEWTLSAESQPSFDDSINQDRPMLVALIAAGITIALSLLFSWLINGRVRAARAAKRMRHELDYREQIERSLRESQAALQRKESHLRTIVESSPECIQELSTSGQLISMNMAGLSMFEVDALEQVNRVGIFSFLHEDDALELRALYKRAIYGEDELTFRMRGYKGTARWLHTKVVPLHLQAEGQLRLLSITSDVTKRVQSEHALQASERRLHEIIDMIPVSLFIKDADSRLTLMNRACEMQWGMAFADLQGTTGSQFFPAGQTQSFLEKDREAFDTGILIDFEEQAWSQSKGENRTVHTFKKPIFDSDGKPDYLIGVSVDITERKVAELALTQEIAERKRVQVELLHSEQFARATIDAISAFLCVLDSTGRIIAVNKAWQYFRHGMAVLIDDEGRAADEVGANYLAMCQHITGMGEADARLMVTGVRAVIARDSDVFSLEYPCHSQIHQRWLLAHVTRFADDSGHVVVSHEDITERKRSELHEHWRNYVLELLAKGESLHVLLDAVIRGVEAENPVIRCSIMLLDNDSKHLLMGAAPSLPEAYRQAIHGCEVGLDAGSCAAAAYLYERVLVEDIQLHGYWQRYREQAARAQLSACWSEPIFDVSGQVLGTFAIYHRQPCNPGPDEIHLLKHAANLAGIAIQRHRAEESLQLSAMVYQHSSEAMLVSDVENRIIAVNPSFTRITGYAAEEIIGKNPSYLGSGRQSASFYDQMWQSLAATGQWQGEVWNRRKNGEEFAEWLTINTIVDNHGLVNRYVALFYDITEKKQSDELIWRQASFDSLTQLPNRRMSRDRLEQEIKKAHRAAQSVALLFIDLDQFKEVNDTLGHHVGDALLIEAAHRICACVRDSDTVARLGGDEFTIILSELSDTSCVGRIAQNIIQTLSQAFTLGDEVVYISASIGITFYPTDALDADNLLKNADQAMYVAKNEGRNRFSYFTKSLQEAAQLRQVLVKDLRYALVENQFRMYFQPIVDLASGRIVKAEALIRWYHPARGLVSPIEFITASEETGLINVIGDWVFRESLRWLKHWLGNQVCPSGFQISINMSPVQFHATDNTHDLWLEYIRVLDLPRNSVVIEITEGLLLHADSGIVDKLAKFHGAGLQIAIDDFGTGYSSLAYLKKFPVDYLKIDQSFVRDLATNANDLALSEAIIVMAHKLGLKVVAEGIENSEQCTLLAEAGCDFGQGYLFSRPITAEQFEVLLKT